MFDLALRVPMERGSVCFARRGHVALRHQPHVLRFHRAALPTSEHTRLILVKRQIAKIWSLRGLDMH